MVTMCACAKFIVILLIMNVNTEAEKNQTQTKRDTSRINRPQRYYAKAAYRIIDNEISKTDDINIQTSKVDTQTSVTLIFLNASYATEVTTVNTVETQKDSEENTSTEEKKSKTTQSTSWIEEETTRQPTEKVPETLVNRKYSKTTKKPCQRGILDLLLPAERVRIFKSYFESFRRFLSSTF